MAKYIQIAPYREDCTITASAITGTMDGRTFVYELPKGRKFNLDKSDDLIECFQTAIAICSHHDQIEWLLNTHLGVKDARFYEKTPLTQAS